MPRRHGLTDKQIAEWRRGPKRYVKKDPEQRGLYLRVPPEGPITFTVVRRDPDGRQIWKALGTTADLKIDQARSLAREAHGRIKKGKPAIEPPKSKGDSVASVTENWLRRHVEKKKLRTGDEYRRVIERYILPYWADRSFVELKRSDIAALQDTIEDKHGTRQADVVLTTLRSIASWVQSRDDSYTPPFVRGMRRVSKQKQERARILSDDELRLIWNAAGTVELMGPLVQLLLLTAQRREKLVTMRWEDIGPDGTWTIRTSEGEREMRGS